ncbi:hypothetical protein EZS27_025208 [termite gut metagenome]|uniref:Uncharacterized protein n=1 Tax=termite gut metagenome TaxID=433724 RepID=A0A5J4QY11_9ZZZZ
MRHYWVLITYLYISKKIFTLNDKKILLGEDGELYSGGANKVFMQGNRKEVHIPQSIQNKITMLHPDVGMESIPQSNLKLLGLKTFNQEEIVDRALELFNDTEVTNSDIIIFLLHFQTESPNIRNNIRRKVLVPVGEKVKWISPIYNPIYIESKELKALYPEGDFINYSVIEHEDKERLNRLFLNLNVWDIPALYFVKENKITDTYSNEHIKSLNKYSKFNSYSYAVYNDRKLHFPEKINSFSFSQL